MPHDTGDSEYLFVFQHWLVSITPFLITRNIIASNTTFQYQLTCLLFFVMTAGSPLPTLIPFSVPIQLS